jgi:hypothetical protein
MTLSLAIILVLFVLLADLRIKSTLYYDQKRLIVLGTACYCLAVCMCWSQLMAVAINCNYNQLLTGFGHPKYWSFNCTGVGQQSPMDNERTGRLQLCRLSWCWMAILTACLRFGLCHYQCAWNTRTKYALAEQQATAASHFSHLNSKQADQRT